MLGSKPTNTPAKRASLPSALSFAISSRRTGPMTCETIRDLGPCSFARETHVRRKAFEHTMVQVAYFVRRSVPAVPLDVVLVVRVVTRLIRIEPVPEVRATLPSKMEIEMQHYRHVALPRRGECTPNAAGQLPLELI